MLTVQKLTQSDLPELAVLYQELMGEPTNLEAMSATFQRMEANPAYLVLVAKLNGVVVGSLMGIVCLELVGPCNPFMVVENVIVAAGQRRIGVGRLLMREIERLARERNCSLIEFCSSGNRKDAHRFYESMGYGLGVVQGFRKWLE
jgi:GNAT superfamily N-acetyltransferase